MDDERRRSDRVEIAASVEFVVDETTRILEATGVDISEHGIAFRTSDPVHVALTLNHEGEDVTRLARLVRLKQEEDGTYIYGLDFVSED